MKQKESLGLCLKVHTHCPKEISVTLLLVTVLYLVFLSCSRLDIRELKNHDEVHDDDVC